MVARGAVASRAREARARPRGDLTDSFDSGVTWNAGGVFRPIMSAGQAASSPRAARNSSQRSSSATTREWSVAEIVQRVPGRRVHSGDLATGP